MEEIPEMVECLCVTSPTVVVTIERPPCHKYHFFTETRLDPTSYTQYTITSYQIAIATHV